MLDEKEKIATNQISPQAQLHIIHITETCS